MMFTQDEREELRGELLRLARSDPKISAASITGSAALNREDRWSDIDLAFAVSGESSVEAVLPEWTATMYEEHAAVHHVDIRAGAWVYRVFLLRNTLQVDLAFVASDEFRALGPSFQVVFGEAKECQTVPPQPLVPDLLGMAWLYAIHARSSLARNQLWQAEYMVSGVRDHALALACVRHGLPAVHGRGIDHLPGALKAAYEDSFPHALTQAELLRAFKAVVGGLLVEIEFVGGQLAVGLTQTMRDVLATVEIANDEGQERH